MKKSRIASPVPHQNRPCVICRSSICSSISTRWTNVFTTMLRRKERTAISSSGCCGADRAAAAAPPQDEGLKATLHIRALNLTRLAAPWPRQFPQNTVSDASGKRQGGVATGR